MIETPIIENLEKGPSKGGNQFIDVDAALGYRYPDLASSYDERDVALYALGVGAAKDPTDETDLSLVYEMSGKGMGMTAVLDADGGVAGIFTDGDLRRCLERFRDLAAVGVAEVMTRTPRTIGADRLAIDCVELMETVPKVMVLLVVDAERRLVGALHLHDLFRARVV